jgi:hypothetical protein
MSNKYTIPKFNANMKFKLSYAGLYMWITKNSIIIGWGNLSNP